MDSSTCFLLISFILTFVYFTTAISGRCNSRLPPGPYPFPIIGNLLELGDKPHCSLATLSKHYGPLLSLKLGSRTTIVVSSPDIAKELFQTNDQSISSRSVPDTAQVMDHDKYSIVWLPAGDHWRKLRRITKEYMFSIQQLDTSEALRKEKVQELVNYVAHCSTSEKPVSIGEVVFTTILNILSNFMFSKDLAEYDSAPAHEFKDAVWSILEVAGKPNLADFYPILKPFDPQRLLRKANVHGKKIMAILDRIIDERMRLYSDATPTNNDVLDLLLNLTLKDGGEFSQNDMRHLFFALFIAGSDTVSSTLEWAMAELIRNPEKMKTAAQKSSVTCKTTTKIYKNRISLNFLT